MRNLVLVLGDQLNLDNPALDNLHPEQDLIVMAEVMEESTHVWSHPQRITLFLSAMRHFAQSLIAQALPLRYFTLESHDYPSLTAVWQAIIVEYQPQRLVVCEPGDWRILQHIQTLAAHHLLILEVSEERHFLCSRRQFAQWAHPYSKQASGLRMEFFYRMMRRQYAVLMQDDTPVGGTWNYDADNRQPFAKTGPQAVPDALNFAPDSITQSVMGLVRLRFAHHPGRLDNFAWPVTREQALQLLHAFIQHKLPQFGATQDAMWQNQPVLWHSLLSSSLNLKLLHPREVIAAAEQAYAQGKAPLNSVEGFIRQILGWREFIRGVYWLEMPDLKQANYFNHHTDLPDWFWTGRTQMQCLSQCIDQTLQQGYAHHIQRLMVIGLFATLAGLKPQQVADWFLAVYVDAVEWVELPNVAGMALFANGGRFTSKPYIASGAYIQRMSNYCQHCRYDPAQKTGERACPYTTFYWDFLIRHETTFARHPRMALMVKHVAKMRTEEKEAIVQFADSRRRKIQAL